MLYVFTGTDREKARTAMDAAVEKHAGKGAETIRVNDAGTRADLEAALQGAGMFGGARAVVLDGIMANEEMRLLFVRDIERIGESSEQYFLLEEKPDAVLRKLLEKHAENVEKFEAVKSEKEDAFFPFVNAFRAGKKKDLWVLLQREYAAGKAPEALHGSLFWAAKQMILRPRVQADIAKGQRFVAALTALPHESRRRGEELEYALERFVLEVL